jgi:predicted kinase
MAGQLQTPFLAVECVCPPEVAMERIGRRLAEGKDASEARPELHLEQRARWEAWPASAQPLQVDTVARLGEQQAAVLKRLARLLPST